MSPTAVLNLHTQGYAPLRQCYPHINSYAPSAVLNLHIKSYSPYFDIILAHKVVTYSPHKVLCPLLQSYPFRYRAMSPTAVLSPHK